MSSKKKINEASSLSGNLASIYMIDLDVDIDPENWDSDRTDFFEVQKLDNHNRFIERLGNTPTAKSGGKILNHVEETPFIKKRKQDAKGAWQKFAKKYGIADEIEVTTDGIHIGEEAELKEAIRVADGVTDWCNTGDAIWDPDKFHDFIETKKEKHNSFINKLAASGTLKTSKKTERSKEKENFKKDNKINKYISVGKQKALAGDVCLHSDDDDFERQEDMVKRILSHQKFNRENPRQATFFVSIKEHFGSTSLKNIMLEKSFEESDIPTNFWLVTTILPKNTERNKKHFTDQIVNGKLQGVEGIADSQKVVGSFFTITGNVILALPGKETVNKNKLSRILYDTPDYLASNDLSAAKRIANKENNYELLRNFISFESRKHFEAIGFDKEGHILGRSGIEWDIKNDLKSMKVKSVKDLARQLRKIIIDGFNKNKGSGSNLYYAQLLEKIPLADWEKVLVLWLEDKGKFYKGEGEWVVKDKTLNIPERTLLMVLENDEEAIGAIKDHNLDKKYRTRIMSVSSWNKIFNKLTSND